MSAAIPIITGITDDPISSRRNTGRFFFFMINLLDRRSNLQATQVDALRNAIAHVRVAHPFSIDATVILAEHLHAIWTLPPDDKVHGTGVAAGRGVHGIDRRR